MRFPLRRRLCRLLFCVCCLSPTALVGAAALIVHALLIRLPGLASGSPNWLIV